MKRAAPTATQTGEQIKARNPEGVEGNTSRDRPSVRDWTVHIGDEQGKGESAHTPKINALAREWGDHVGGFKQAQKVVREAFEAGLAAAPETAAAERDKLREQRDELLAACKTLTEAYQWDAKTYGFPCKHSTIDEARAAIKHAEKLQ